MGGVGAYGVDLLTRRAFRDGYFCLDIVGESRGGVVSQISVRKLIFSMFTCRASIKRRSDTNTQNMRWNNRKMQLLRHTIEGLSWVG